MKSKILIAFLFLILFTNYQLPITNYQCLAQDNNRLVTLTKQIMEAKQNVDTYLAFEELTDLYFSRAMIKSEGGIPLPAGKENKYNEFIEFLESLANQKKELGPVVNYYIGLTRYYQLKYLEEAQDWDEYFSQGNTYRDEISNALQKTISLLPPQDALNIYAKLILWKFHQDQQDVFSESALSELMSSTLTYAKEATNLVPLKDVAGEFLSYGQKGKAKDIYKVYVGKIITSDTKDEDLNKTASDFYKEGNLELAEAIYDAYIERITKSMPKEKLIPILIGIAKDFAYKDDGPKDAFYAEKVFTKIEEIGTKDAFDEELIYLRAFNLEKSKEYPKAKDLYVDLVQRYPKTTHADEADYKVGIIYAYILRDIKNGKSFFEKLALKGTLSPQVISSLYQLGLLSQWEDDFTKAKEYYNKLIEKAGDDFGETVSLAKERLKELEESKPIEYNLKTFLDVSLKEENAIFDTTKLDLRASLYNIKKDAEIKVEATTYTAESGCMQIELQYLWSGHLGKAKPTLSESSFNTTFAHLGTKEINLVVVSSAGIIDRNIDMTDAR